MFIQHSKGLMKYLNLFLIDFFIVFYCVDMSVNSNPHKSRLGKEPMTSRAHMERVIAYTITKRRLIRRSGLKRTSQMGTSQVVDHPQDQYYHDAEEHYEQPKEPYEPQHYKDPKHHGSLEAPRAVPLYFKIVPMFILIIIFLMVCFLWVWGATDMLLLPSF